MQRSFSRTRSRTRESSSFWFAIALAATLVLGIFVAWSPRFWAVAALYSAVLPVAGSYLFFTRRIRFSWNSATVATIAAWGWLQLAFLGTAVRSSTRLQALQWTVAAFAFFLASQILGHSRARAAFLAVFLWAASAFALLAVLQMYSSPDQVLWMFPAQQYSVGTFLYKNQFAAMLEFAVPVALYWIFFKESKRIPGICALVALLGGAIAGGSRAGLALMLAECLGAVFIAYWHRKLRLVHVLAILPAAFLGLAAVALLFINESAWTHFQEVQPDVARQELLKSTIQMVQREPWSGYGLGTWSTIYPQYATFDIGRYANAAHNDWAEWTAEGGFLFAGSILALLASVAKQAVRSVWGLGVVSVMLHSWVDYPTREPVLCVLWFTFAGALTVLPATRPAVTRLIASEKDSHGLAGEIFPKTSIP